MSNYDFNTYANIDEHYIMPTYGKRPLLLTYGKGVRLYDSEGREYLDFGSGIGVASLGYGDRAWVKAVQAQAGAVAHVSNYYYHPNYIQLAEKLCNVTNMEQIFFCNSGAEANEGAIKLARKYSFDKYGAGRNRIICLKNSFHGRTVTTLSATGQDVFHNYFFPFTEGFGFVSADDPAALAAALDESVCAVMVEPIQGEGGVLPLGEELIAALAQLKERDILLICDEVQSGVGRTGTFLASESFGLSPDIVTIAKGLGGGLPIGAFLCEKKLAGVLDKSSHGTTFGSNPVCCAGALVVTDRVADPKFLAGVKATGEHLVKKLLALKSPHITQVRGRGLMLGVELDGVAVSDLLPVLRKNGLLALSAKTALRLLPPLVLTKRDADKGVAIIGQSLAEFD